MKHIIRKPYWNYEKEERWLNEMAAKGLALTNYSWCKYVFENTPKGEYIYRIVLLDNTITHPESQKYIEFIEETGAEFVSSYMRWVYFRKKATDGAFDIYSDIDSKIKHYKKINVLWNTLVGIEFSVAAVNLSIGLSDVGDNIVNTVLGSLLFALGCFFIAIGAPIRKKIRRLKKEKEIRES